jgi:hypothetical protein
MITSSHFGDYEALEKIPREFDAVAEANCQLLVMRQFAIKKMQRKYALIFDEMKKLAQEKREKNLEAM